MSTIRGERDKAWRRLLNGANRLTLPQADRLIIRFNKLSKKLNEPTFQQFVDALKAQLEAKNGPSDNNHPQQTN